MTGHRTRRKKIEPRDFPAVFRTRNPQRIRCNVENRYGICYNDPVKIFSGDEMELQKRKINRLSNYDYSSSGYYFITICTANKQKFFGNIVGERNALPKIELSNYGKIVEKSINNISKCYDGVFVDKYVIMPNHLHLIIIIKYGNADMQSGSAMRSPTISNIVGQMKSYVTKQAGISIWQKSFYDHIIRDENDYLRIAEYIENNPAKWAEDKYFVV